MNRHRTPEQSREALSPVFAYSADDFSRWIVDGFVHSRDQKTLYKAFAPAADFFSNGEDPEIMLGEGYALMPLQTRVNFIKGLDQVISGQCPAPDPDYMIFNECQSVLSALGNRGHACPSSIAYMVNRVLDPKFIDQRMALGIAQHIFANAFIVIRSSPMDHTTVGHLQRLRAGSHYHPDYAAYVQETERLARMAGNRHLTLA